MSNIFKNLGKGVLYVLLFPFIIAAIVLAGAVGLLIFIYQFVKNIILFFQGKSIFKPLDEDIKAEAIMKGIENSNGVNGASSDPSFSSTPAPENDYQTYTTGPFTNTAPGPEVNSQPDEIDDEDATDEPEIGDDEDEYY